MPLYRNILRQAWKITWQYKYLWFFGLFAALLGNGGEYEILFRGVNNANTPLFPGLQNFVQSGFFSRQTLANIGVIIRTDTASFIIALVLGLVILLLFFFLVWLSVSSQAALVNNSAGYFLNKKSDFKTGMAVGSQKFWPVFGYNVIIKAVLYLAFILMGIPLLYIVPRLGLVWGGIIYFIFFIVFMVLVLGVSFMLKYSIAFLVVKGNKFLESIKLGWNLFISNWLISLEMAFILFFISLVVSLLYFLVILALGIPVVFLLIASAKVAASMFLVVAFLALIFYVLSLAFVGATLSTFQISTWTGLFVQLVNKGGESKIVRIVNGMIK